MDRIQYYEKHELLRLVTRDGFVVNALLVTNKEDKREQWNHPKNKQNVVL